MKLGGGTTNSSVLLLLKFSPFPYTITAISWPPSWISHLFSLWLFGGCTLFLQLDCFGLGTLYIQYNLLMLIYVCVVYLFSQSKVTLRCDNTSSSPNMVIDNGYLDDTVSIDYSHMK